MSNITNLNRDYLIKINVKEATIDVPKMTFWNTDKKTSNMFVQLVINMSTNELISNYVTVQNATDYKITLNVIKPKTNQYKTIEATLLNEEKALFEIDLPDEYKDQVGNYNFEFEVSSKVDGNDESITTSNGTYKVNGSILTNLNEETSSSPDLPILKQLIEQVKSLQGGDLTGYQKKSDNSLETTSKEVVGAINEVNSQFKDIAKQTITTEERTKLTSLKNYDDTSVKTNIQSVQQQVNNLVLGAIGDGNNAEVVQARGEYKLLNDRMEALSNSTINIVNITNTIPYKLLMKDGTITSSNESTAVVTDFIEVNYGEKIKYKGAWYVSTRSGVCGYDENYKFVKSIIDYNPSTEYRLAELTEFTIDDVKIKYIKASSNNTTEYPFQLTIYEEIAKRNTNEINLLKSASNKAPQTIKTINNSQLLPVGTQLDENYIECIQLGTAGSFDDLKIESPYVWWDENKLKYGMTYTGYKNDGNGKALYGSIGLAWSNNLTTWVKDEKSPIFTKNTLSGKVDSGSVTGGTIWYEDGMYYLFYVGSDVSGYEAGNPKLCIATSTDLYNWTRYENNPIISPGGSSWYNSEIYKPNIVKWKDNKYYMFINCKGTDGVNNEITRERIGYAISNDLYTWVMKDVVIDVEVGKFDEIIAGDPYIYDIGDNNIYMAYFGFNGKTGIRDGLAYTTKSDFPLGWKKYENNPILNVEWKGKPCIIYRNGEQYHFYGCGGGNGHIGYVKAK